MNHLVKITIDDDGAEKLDAKWCYISELSGHHTLCTGEFFGYGESGCVFETKAVKKGGITCPVCLEIIRHHKSIKL